MCRRTSRSHFCADTWLIAKINRVAAWERIMVLYVVLGINYETAEVEEKQAYDIFDLLFELCGCYERKNWKTF